MRRFYLFQRGNIWYIQLKDPKTGKKLSAKSSGTADREQAEFIAQKWIYEGIPSADGKDTRSFKEVLTVNEVLENLKSIDGLTADDVKKFLTYFKSQGFIPSSRLQTDNTETLFSFLSTFWDYDNSPYIKERLFYGHKITRNYCHGLLQRFNLRWKSFFDDMPLCELTRQDLKDFSQHLAQSKTFDKKGNETDKPLSANSINQILKVGTVALKWAADNQLIETNPAANLRKFSGTAKRRGILTDDEVRKLFSIEWPGYAGKRLGNILAMQTGLRLGEIVALRVQDIEDGKIRVRHSWGELDGLKGTKTGEERIVPILSDLQNELINHAKDNPAGCGPTSWIFWAIDRQEGPYRGRNLSDAFIQALEGIGIDEDQRQARGITFHGWRHYYAKKMADALDIRAAKLTGHATPKMLEHYANHAQEEDLKQAAVATEQVFGKILDFRKVSGGEK